MLFNMGSRIFADNIFSILAVSIVILYLTA